MSLVTQMLLVEKYGVLLSVEQLAEVTGLEIGTVRNQISAETFAIPTKRQGGRRVAHYADVAAYLDSFKSA